MRPQPPFRKEGGEEEDPLLDYLTTFRDRIEHMRKILTDKTARLLLRHPVESLPIA